MQIIDITLPLSNQTPVWEGDEGVTIRQVAFKGHQSDFNVSRMEMGVHAGTHIDAPFHLFDEGKTVEHIPLNILIGEVVILEIPPEFSVINAQALCVSGFEAGIERVILKTQNTNYWVRDPHGFNSGFIGIDSDGAEFLVEQGVRLVGIDYFSVSPINDLVKPHEILLGAGVVILENACLVDVSPGVYQLICLPLKMVGVDGAPVRAVLTR